MTPLLFHVNPAQIDWSDLTQVTISATILVEREGQKGIVVGQGGSMIKRVGVEARKDLEKLFGRKVYLDLQVRVQPLWRRDANEIKRLGYSTED